MRYLSITYFHRPRPRHVPQDANRQDEQVEVLRRLRDRELSTAAVILDFRDRQVIKASLAGVSLPRDFQRIRDYYYQHYPAEIDQLEYVHGRADTEITPPGPDHE